MFYGICAILVSMVLVLITLSNFTPSRQLRGSAMHPYNFFGFFIVIVILDFFFAHYSVVLNGDAISFARQSIMVEDELVSGISFFAFSIIAAVIGIGLATFQGVHRGPPPDWAAELGPPPGYPRHGIARPQHASPGLSWKKHRPASQLPASAAIQGHAPFGPPIAVPSRQMSAEQAIGARAATYTLLFCGCLGLLVTIQVVLASLTEGDLLHVAGMRQLFFRANPILIVLYSLLVPSFILYGSYRPRVGVRLVVLALAVMLLLFPLGGRGTLLLVVIAMAFWAAAGGFTVNFFAVYLATPLVGIFLLIVRYYSREADKFDSLQAYLSEGGGALSLFFNTPEISMAEAMSVNLVNQMVERAPFDSIVGVLLAFVPRAIIPWKPFGASAEFTMAADLARWELVKSEWTVTGFVNLFLDFGYLGAIAGSGALAYIWARVFCTHAARGGQALRFWGPVSIVMLYIFFRADLYNLGLFLWPLSAVLLIHWGFTKIVHMRILPGQTPHPVGGPEP